MNWKESICACSKQNGKREKSVKHTDGFPFQFSGDKDKITNASVVIAYAFSRKWRPSTRGLHGSTDFWSL